MAQYNRPPKKKTRGPDEFISFFDHLVRYFAHHKNKLIGLIVAAALMFSGYGIYLYRQNQRVKQFASLYGEALVVPPQQALEYWQQLASKNPPLKLEDLIALQMGGIYAQEENWMGAATQFQKAAVSRSLLLKYLGQWAEAVALENARQWEQAQQEYQEMAENKENPFKDYGRLGLARSLAAAGQEDRAEVILYRLVAKDAEVPQGVKAAAMNQLLAMQMKAPPSRADSKASPENSSGKNN